MADLVMDHAEREPQRMNNAAFARIGRWLMAALMIFLGLSGPALCYIKALEPHADRETARGSSVA
jgi:hypothetical protein